MKSEAKSDRLKNILIKEDLGISDNIFEILKQDITKLFSEYLYLKNGVRIQAETNSDGIKITVAVEATGVKNIRIIS